MLIPELIIGGIILLIIWLITSFVLYLAGRVISGANAKFTDALLITLIGNILNFIISMLFTFFVDPILVTLPFGGLLSLIIPWIIVLIIYIWLIMKFFDTGVLGAIGVGLLVIIISIIIAFILGIFLAVLLLFLFFIWP